MSPSPRQTQSNVIPESNQLFPSRRPSAAGRIATPRRPLAWPRRSLCLLLAAALAGCGVSTVEGSTVGDPAPDAQARRNRPRPGTTDPAPAPAPTPTDPVAPTDPTAPGPTSPAPTGAPGTILWQVALTGPYSSVRPAVGPDGSVYAVDVYGSLTAVAPDGSLRWQVTGAGGKGLAVGTDGTVYTADEGAVRAYGPDGTLRWTFLQNPRAFVMAGLGLGPDGNLYGVATNGLGVFSLTPGGSLRWATAEPYDRPFVGYAELAFGPNGSRRQLAFYANAHIRAVDLSGSSVFTLPRGGQPALDQRDGSLHVGDAAYRADGSPLFAFGFSVGGLPALGPDGTHFFVLLQSTVFALDTAGRELWHLPASDWLQDPSIDPAGTLLLFGANDPATFGGVLVAISTGGAPLWRLPLPALNGLNQVVDTRASFSPDGGTAYLVTRAGGARLTAVSLR
jgi:hypothetical protein